MTIHPRQTPLQENAPDAVGDISSPGPLGMFFWLGVLARKVFLRQPVDNLDIPDVQIGTLRPTRLLGTGAYGAVFLARDLTLQRDVALKVAWPSVMLDPVASSRFVEEPKTVASLSHPGIVKVYESGAIDMLHYISLEYIEGPTLAGRLERESRLPCREAAFLMEQVARAIHFAHEHGVIHRDLKPSNILLTRRSESPDFDTPVVTDFGLARHSRPLTGNFTQSYSMLGTDHYMSPEQAAGRMKEVQEASDVFALGVILFESITGNKPFDGETSMDIHREILEEPPRAWAELRSFCSADLEAIIDKCLRKSPTLRYRTAGELADDLGRYLRGEPIKARRATFLQRCISYARRHPVRFAFGAFSLLVASLVGAMISNHFTAQVRLAFAMKAANDADVRERQFRYAIKLQTVGRRLDQLTASEIRDELRESAALAHDFGPGVEWNVLDAMTRIEIDSWRAHSESIYQLSLSPDNKILASASKDGHVRLWDWPSKRLIADFDDGMGEVNCVLFSPDGNSFAYAGDDGRLLVRSSSDHRVRIDHKLSEDVLNELIWLDDGQRIATGGRGTTVYLFDISLNKVVNSRKLRTLDPSVPFRRSPAVETLCLLSEPRSIVAGISPRGGYLLSPETLEVIGEIPLRDEPIMMARTFPELGPNLITSADTITLWKTSPFEAMASIFHSGGFVDAIGHSPSEKTLFVTRNSILFGYSFDANAPPRLVLRQRHASSWNDMDAMEVTHDGRTVITGDNAGNIKTWSAMKLATSFDIELPHGISAIEFSPCGRWLAITRGMTVESPDLSLFEVQSGRHLWTKRTWDDQVARTDNRRFSFHPSGESLAVATDDSTICEIDCGSGKELQKYLDPVKGVVRCVQFTPDGSQIFATDRSGTAYLVDRTNGTALNMPIEKDRWCIGVFRTCLGDMMVDTHRNGDASLIDLSGDRRKVQLPGLKQGLNIGAVSPDGALFVATGQNDIYLWNLKTLDTPILLRGHSGGLLNLQFSSDGKTIISHALDGTLWLWNVATAMPMLRLGDSSIQIAGVTLSSDQKNMLVLSQVDHRNGLQIFRLMNDDRDSFPRSLELTIEPAP